MGTVLYVTAEVVRQIGILIRFIMPDSADKLLDQINIAADKRGFDQLGAKGRLVSGTRLEKPIGVFPRYVEEAGGK